MLEEDAPVLLEDFNGKPNNFMTMAYEVREEFRQDLIAVINIDGFSRPQILGKQ